MNVQYKGRQTVNSFGDKLVRPLEPAAIISFTEEEEGKVVAILEETGYDFDIFGEPGFLWAEVAVDGKEDYTDAMKLGMLTFYFATSGVYAEPVIEDRLAKQICRIVRETHLTLHEREELFLDTIRDDTLPEHIMSAKDCAYIFDVCAAGRVEDAREMLGRFVTAHVAK